MQRVAWAIVLAGVVACLEASPPAPQKPPAKTETVAVVGCLTEATPGVWSITRASEPVASTANAPSAKERAELPQGGKREFRLIGVGIFNLSAHRGETVVVKGLLLKDVPVSRLNVTSVTTLSRDCPATTGTVPR